MHILNYLPTKALGGLALVLKLFGKQPYLLTLRVFSCKCYPLLRSYNRHKLQNRSALCVFLGYAKCYKGYKCKDQNGRIYILRYVRFDEHVFPFQKFESVTNTTDRSSVWTLSSLPVLVQTPNVVTNAVTNPLSSTEVYGTGASSSRTDTDVSNSTSHIVTADADVEDVIEIDMDVVLLVLMLLILVLLISQKLMYMQGLILLILVC